MKKLTLVITLLMSGRLVFAATPSAGTLSSANQTVTWSGGPYTGVTPDNSPLNTSLCTSLTCDKFNLSVQIPSKRSVSASTRWRLARSRSASFAAANSSSERMP